MIHKKFECANGWIVVIANTKTGEVIEVHSSGLVSSGSDDNAFSEDYIRYIERAIMDNELHTQQPGTCGVRWPEDN